MSLQLIKSDKGEWEIAVARHAAAPTFTFDITASTTHMLVIDDTATVISCHNMTRADLERHVANCQAALAEEPEAARAS